MGALPARPGLASGHELRHRGNRIDSRGIRADSGEDEVVSHGLDGEEDEEEASAAAAVSSAAAALMAKEDQNHEEVGEMELETDAGSVVSEDQTVTGEDDKPELS